MKILFLARYISVDNDITFRHKTGYGYMVKDIADSISKTGVEVDLITHSGFTKQRKIGKINILNKSKFDLFNGLKMFYCIQGIKFFFRSTNTFRRKLKEMLYFFSAGYLEKILILNKYDLVHIHGMELFSIPFMLVCVKTKTPFIITLHGLNSIREDPFLSNLDKEIERRFLKMSTEKNITTTVVSNGILTRIKENYHLKDYTNFNVIQNGTNINISRNDKFDDIKNKYNILEDQEIILCVGNISDNKNQKQVVRVFGLLTENEKNRLKLLIIGNDLLSDEVNYEIKKNNLEKYVFLTGTIPKNDMYKYYSISKYNITASMYEGFGLPIIEAFTFGIPTICFSDIDAYNELYDENCMIPAKERSDEALLNALREALNRNIDKKYIIEYSKRFSLEEMSQKYFNIYKNIGTSIVSYKDIMHLVN